MSNKIPEYTWNIVESGVKYHKHKYLMELTWIRIDNIGLASDIPFWKSKNGRTFAHATG